MSTSLTNLTNPLKDSSYLLSAVETITDSLNDITATSAHDLLDAYNTFSNRVRSQSQMLHDCNEPLPTLDCLQRHKGAFFQALRRDIGLAHVDSFLALSRPRLSSDEITLGVDSHTNIRVDAKQHARDSSSLCGYALCALAAIFRFPAFHSLFTVHELSELLGDVLGIALATQLPVLNGAKIRSLSLWILGCHRLPLAAVSARNTEIFSALQRSLGGTIQPGGTALDGLKAISHTVEQYPSHFFAPLSRLMGDILPHLLSEPSDVRLHASIVLGRFALALVNQTEALLTERRRMVSADVLSFLELHGSDEQSLSGDTNLPYIVRDAFSAESQTRPGEGPIWILTVLASLIILSGPSLFSNSRAMTFILQSLAMALTHKRSVVRALHPHAWKCLVWVFHQMLSGSRNTDSAVRSALFVVKQELGGGIGVGLAAVLLHSSGSSTDPERSQRLSQALSVIQAMARMDCKHTRQQGLALLQAMMRGIGEAEIDSSSSTGMDCILASALFDGTITSTKWERLPAIIRSIHTFTTSYVRPLFKAEVSTHHETLLDIWKNYAYKPLKERLDSVLVDLWRSILLAQSQIAQLGVQHPAAPSESLKHTALLVTGFLPTPPCPSSQPDWGSWSVQDQLHRLTAVEQLWSAMQNIFVPPSLSEPAEIILASILKYAFHILDPEVGALWSKLCANLMTTASPSFLGGMHNLTESQMAVRAQRELWGVVAKSLSDSDSTLHWRKIVSFLAIPVCTWILSESELEVWGAMLQSAMSSNQSSDDSTSPIETFMEVIQEKDVANWEPMLDLFSIVLSCFQVDGHTPPDTVLGAVDVSLSNAYGRAWDSPDSLGHSLRFLAALRECIVSSTPLRAMHLLISLRHSLRLWVEDRLEVMSVDDFNSVAVSFYCETLTVLEKHPLSVESLQQMETFLTSGFSRIPTPAIAPFAFEKFWKATYHGQSQFFDVLPPRIKACLACFVAAYGGDLADGLSLPTESQSQSQIISNGLSSQLSHPSDPYLQDPSFLDAPWFSPKEDEMVNEAFDDEGPSLAQEPTFPGAEDAAFLVASSDDEASQPTVLQHLREYSGRVNTSLDELEVSIGESLRLLPSPILSPAHRLPIPRSPERPPVTSQRKRKYELKEDAPKKRSRTSRSTLRSLRKVESEPASRSITPVMVARTNSMPTTCRKMVFDGVELPTLREILRKGKAREVKETKTTPSPGCSPSAMQRTPSPSRAFTERRMSWSPLSPSVGSEDEEDFDDWERTHLDGTSSEMEIDKSLGEVYPSSPPRSQSTGTHEPPGLASELHMTPGPNLRPTRSQSEGSPWVPSRPPMRRANRMSARLDALQEVYASMEDGASQIPVSELLQATKLVHKIGAVLTEQMGRKFGGSG
ncbi:hypothetical protein HYDPIDRAFT_41726 [Hydnomerulius pinastri MD-312]|uniref:Unplaced genomic scaffold scaffold_20, whole genome shotgun sequence n=1 Tax=Hydnomerulius pinastri MD-312 TaxID=994086 RepID=A0A0C9WDL1_9AGAM|nr:hypothetical protein HYDPIDRAFT_41726 [Hydnomerulius pinastri MD-312]